MSRLRRRLGSMRGMLAGLFRVSVYFAVVAVLAALFFARTVHARVGEGALAFGRGLASFRELLEGAHRVAINGESLVVASTVADAPIGQVLDRVERECAAQPAGLPVDVADLSEAARKKLAEKAPFLWEHRLGIFREERETEGSIVCIQGRPDDGGVLGVVARWKALAESGDVHALGDLRYVYARRTDGGKTHVLSTMTDGPFNLYRLVGQDSTEPGGADPAEAPRPPASRRVLSAEVEGSMYAAYLYLSSSSVEETQKFYESGLRERGWSLAVGNPQLGLEMWQRAGVTMAVHVVQPEAGASSTVTLALSRTTSPPEGPNR